MASIARRVVVTGRVTGVGFRYATVCQARQYPELTGFVRNVNYRTVECVVQGPAADVEAMTAWLRQGPPGAQVVELQVTEMPPHGVWEDFRIAR